MIGSSRCLPLSKLVGVIALVSVFDSHLKTAVLGIVEPYGPSIVSS